MLFRISIFLLTYHLECSRGTRIVESGKIRLTATFVEGKFAPVLYKALNWNGDVNYVGPVLQIEIGVFSQPPVPVTAAIQVLECLLDIAVAADWVQVDEKFLSFWNIL